MAGDRGGESHERLDSRPRAVYRPQVFDVPSIPEAMRMIVTPEQGTNSTRSAGRRDARPCGRQRQASGHRSRDVSFGLRLRHRVRCQGADRAIRLSRLTGEIPARSTRLLAPEYVLSERFTVWSPEVLDKMIGKGFRVDAAISLRVIQHVLDATKSSNASPGRCDQEGTLYALNSTRRVPTDRGWVAMVLTCKKGCVRSCRKRLATVASERNYAPVGIGLDNSGFAQSWDRRTDILSCGGFWPLNWVDQKSRPGYCNTLYLSLARLGDA